MAPTLVFRPDGRLRLVTGSPGSSAIVGYVVKSVVGTLDWNLDVQTAAALPNVLNRNGPTELEAGTSAEKLAEPLRALGHRTIAVPLTSGIHAVELRGACELHGASDPRRDGAAEGF
jgi:gamma-glutamyltranspeptidase/glutathione hydrolase